MVGWWWGGLFDYNVKPGPDLSRLSLSLVRLVTRGKGRARSLTILVVGLLHNMGLTKISYAYKFIMTSCLSLERVIFW